MGWPAKSRFDLGIPILAPFPPARMASVMDIIERAGDGFMLRVDEGYRALADESPERIVALDGERPADEIAEEVREHVRALL